MNTLRKAGLALALTVASMGAHANLLVNGSFEDLSGTYNFSNPNWNDIGAGSGAISGWTIGGAGIDWHTGGEFIPIQDGTKAVDLNNAGIGSGTGTIAQSFATTIGQLYHLSFYLAGPENGNSNVDPRVVTVNINGSNTNFSQPESPNTSLVWGLKTLDFTALAGTSTLTFSSPNEAGFWGPVLDNVSVEAVPEPSTLALLGLGFAGFGFSRRKLRKPA